ncbi:hypothetical protein JCM3775_003645 [Rhodotorula graminis]
MAAPPPSHYALLSLSPSATPEQVRAAYLRLAKDRHPDRAPPEQREAAKRAFQDLAAAYRVLSDPALRRAYDVSLAHPSPPPPRDARPARSPHPHQLPSTRRCSSAPPDSPFPGFRVPPGGYPHPLSLSRPPEPHSHPHPHGLAPRRARSPAPSTSSAVLRESGSGIALDPLGGLDPVAGLLGALGDGLEDGLEDDGRGRSRRDEGYGVPSWAQRGRMREDGEKWAAGAGGARRERREWREGRREANGEGFSFQGMQEVEQLPGGGIAWRGESVTVSFSSPTRPLQHPHHHPPPPQHPAARAPRRSPSAARGPQLALAGRAQAQLALTAHAHESPRSVAVRQRRTSAGELGRARAPESPLFG